MTADEAEAVVGAVEFREKVIVQLAIFAGLRPGEILALQRRHVAPDRSSVEINQRVYRGDIDRPKNGESRFVAVPPRTAALLAEWLDTAVGPGPESWVFASKTGESQRLRRCARNICDHHVKDRRRVAGRFQRQKLVAARNNVLTALVRIRRRAIARGETHRSRFPV
jgi:integrase